MTMLARGAANRADLIIPPQNCESRFGSKKGRAAVPHDCATSGLCLENRKNAGIDCYGPTADT
jgi:hypothetical protein